MHTDDVEHAHSLIVLDFTFPTQPIVLESHRSRHFILRISSHPSVCMPLSPPFVRTPQKKLYEHVNRIDWENVGTSCPFDTSSVGTRLCFARDNRKTYWRIWCKTIFSPFSVLHIEEQGTTRLNVQLGECDTCDKVMYKNASDFSSVSSIGSNTTVHQVLDRTCYTFYTVSF